MKVHIRTYGCTLNQADSDAMEARLKASGIEISGEEEADVIVVNTCAVKDATEKKQLFFLQNIDKPLVVAGCLTYNKNLIKKIVPKASLVSTGAISKINEAVLNAKKGIVKDYIFFEEKKRRVLVRNGIARIALQDGCTEFCTFCATKLARPKLISESPRRVYEMIKEAIEKGAFEIQLAGMDTGAYGLDIKTNLYELMKGIERNFNDYYGRMRVGMLNMVHINRIGYKLLEAFEGKIFYKFFHLPVQSGSQRILDLMKRRHSIEDFYKAVEFIRRKYPHSVISTDIIVGFPTEEEEDFEKTIKLLEDLEIDVVNLSKFSPRPFTKASKMPQLDPQIIKRRSKELSEIIKEIGYRVNKRYVGKVFDVLVTEEAENLLNGRKVTKGRTNFYKQVVLDRRVELGKWVKVKVVDNTSTSLLAEVIEN